MGFDVRVEGGGGVRAMYDGGNSLILNDKERRETIPRPTPKEDLKNLKNSGRNDKYATHRTH